jgi:type II secretion system protein G
VSIILTWVIISGSLLWWHYTLMRIRWAPDHTITQNHMKQIQLALEAYAKDCGTFPTEEQGLTALIVNPGIAKWAGPYNELQVKSLSDSWGNPIQYQIHKNGITLWSYGADGKDGTKDDIRLTMDKNGITEWYRGPKK